MSYLNTINKPMPSKTSPIGCAIITHRAKHHLAHCLAPLINSPLKPRIVVVNSSSRDGTVEMAREFGVETLIIPRNEFNHGTTREQARHFLGTPIICMLTPDAYLTDEHMLNKLIAPIENGNASAAYARQLPHRGAGFFESFHRFYNYPEKSHIRSISDQHLYGSYTFFCSNSCAAYSNAALDSIGGFEKVLLGEDTVAVARLLYKGHKIAYVAEATVFHSHHYSLTQEFRRNFDIGYARKSHMTLLNCKKSDTKRGLHYFISMLKTLCKKAPYLLPYSFAQVGSKWLGYKIGLSCTNAPIWLKKRLSTQDFYWK